MEVIRSAMLTRHVSTGGAKVLQLGGTTRDLFYYPKGTVQITAASPDLTVGIWEQAGMQAAVPVNAKKTDITTTLTSSAGSIYDSVVAFDQFTSNSNDMKTILKDIYRVLKPGGTFIFIQRVQGSPVAALIRIGGGGNNVAGTFSFFNEFPLMPITQPCTYLNNTDADFGDRLAADDDQQQWDFIQWDLGAGSLDPHAVGVAIKPLQAPVDDQFSADNATFEQVMKSKKGKSGGKGKRGFS